MAPDVATPAGKAQAGTGKMAPNVATPAGTVNAGAGKPGATSTTDFGRGKTPLSGSTGSGPGFSSSGLSGYKRYFNTSTNMGRFGLLMAVGAGAYTAMYLYRKTKEENPSQHPTPISRNKGVV